MVISILMEKYTHFEKYCLFTTNYKHKYKHNSEDQWTYWYLRFSSQIEVLQFAILYFRVKGNQKNSNKSLKKKNSDFASYARHCYFTRSQRKFFNINVIELYRCMPLLGDEHNVPNWEIHIAHYIVIFI